MALTFQATATLPPADQPEMLLSVTDATVPGDGGSWISDLIDVRAYSSYGLLLDVHDGAAIAYDGYRVVVEFYADPAMQYLMYVDEWEVFARPATINAAPVTIGDTIRGGYMRIWSDNTLANGRATLINLAVIGSYRPQVALTCRGSASGTLVWKRAALIAAGASLSVAAQLGAGPAYLGIIGSAGPCKAQLTFGTDQYPVQVIDTATNQEAYASIVLPKKQAKLTITNTHTASQTIDAFVIAQPTVL